jgi:hypothetical protein
VIDRFEGIEVGDGEGSGNTLEKVKKSDKAFGT